MKRIVLIAGPTCSGKSKVALGLAMKFGGAIINADSMQVYREIPILSAQPANEEMQGVPHHLYGHMSAHQHYSTGAWLADASAAIESSHAKGAVPIVVGGTGLYFDALLNGLAQIPAIPGYVRNHVRMLGDRHGVAAIRARLRSLHPSGHLEFECMDFQRAARALEVRLATGKPLSYWQGKGRASPFEQEAFLPVVLLPSRHEIYRRCDQRFDDMLAMGALDETAHLLALQLPLSRPAMKALGVQQLARHLSGEISLEEAAMQAKTATRRYAKRQFTWISGHMISWNTIYEQDSERILSKIFSIIKENGLTIE